MHVLGSGDATLRLSEVGAEAVSWQVGGRELLWCGAEPWRRNSPILFPVVGRCRDGVVRVDGRAYPMEVHGFAAQARFAPVSVSAGTATFRLEDSPATRAQYPFAFQLDVTYRLEATGVTIEFRLENRGARAMPFALGLHPGFAWPFGGGMVEDYAIRFDQHEVPLVPCITTDGLFAAAHRRLDFDGRDLPLTRQLLAQEALCFLDAKSHRLCFLAPDGEAIAVEWENFAHVALWSRPPAPFLCVECWTGHGDPADFDGELAEKPSMRLLDPGDVSEHAVRWRLGKPPCP